MGLSWTTCEEIGLAQWSHQSVGTPESLGFTDFQSVSSMMSCEGDVQREVWKIQYLTSVNYSRKLSSLRWSITGTPKLAVSWAEVWWLRHFFVAGIQSGAVLCRTMPCASCAYSAQLVSALNCVVIHLFGIRTGWYCKNLTFRVSNNNNNKKALNSCYLFSSFLIACEKINMNGIKWIQLIH